MYIHIYASYHVCVCVDSQNVCSRRVVLIFKRTSEWCMRELSLRHHRTHTHYTKTHSARAAYYALYSAHYTQTTPLTRLRSQAREPPSASASKCWSSSILILSHNTRACSARNCVFVRFIALYLYTHRAKKSICVCTRYIPTLITLLHALNTHKLRTPTIATTHGHVPLHKQLTAFPVERRATPEQR
jgi:hypothetical protein